MCTYIYDIYFNATKNTKSRSICEDEATMV